MLGVLGATVGDHTEAAVQNVLAAQPAHFEQAVFADGLSVDSAEMLRALAQRHWQALVSEAVPLLGRCIDEDALSSEPARRRVRLGLFTYHEGISVQAPAAEADAPEAPTNASAKASAKPAPKATSRAASKAKKA